MFVFSSGQLYGSNFLSALRGYGGDVCRFVSCPVGETCVNGVCNGGALLGGYYGGLAGGYGAAGGLGLLGGANKCKFQLCIFKFYVAFLF